MWFKKRVEEVKPAESAIDPKYAKIIDYFTRRRFGSELPVMSILSRMPLSDRCNILSHLLKGDPRNVYIFDKLSMAYAKIGQANKAMNLINEGRKSGILNPMAYAMMKDKVEDFSRRAGSLGSSTSYEEALGHIKNDMASERDPELARMTNEFNNILIEFCQRQLR